MVVGELGSVSTTSTFFRVVQLVCCGHRDLFFIQCTADCCLKLKQQRYDSNYLPVVISCLVGIQAGCCKSGHERL